MGSAFGVTPGMKNSVILALVLGLAFLFLASECQGGDKTLINWPSGASPKEVGQRVAERFLEKAALTSTGTIYPTVCAWYGALTFA
jgi:unsaturated rhamnogalacturonyl hydrolase